MPTQPMINQILKDFRDRYPDKQIGVKAQIYMDIIEFMTNALDLAYTQGFQDALEKAIESYPLVEWFAEDAYDVKKKTLALLTSLKDSLSSNSSHIL